MELDAEVDAAAEPFRLREGSCCPMWFALVFAALPLLFDDDANRRKGGGGLSGDGCEDPVPLPIRR